MARPIRASTGMGLADQRSRLTNGKELLPGIDGKSAEARRFKDLFFAFVGEMGGDATITEADRSLCRMAASMTVRGEAMQAALVRGEAVDDEQLVRVVNSTTRTLTALRRAKTQSKPKDLRTHLAGRRGERVTD